MRFLFALRQRFLTNSSESLTFYFVKRSLFDCTNRPTERQVAPFAQVLFALDFPVAAQTHNRRFPARPVDERKLRKYGFTGGDVAIGSEVSAEAIVSINGEGTRFAALHDENCAAFCISVQLFSEEKVGT